MIDTWTPERIRQLTELVTEGVSFSQIGARMGITKSAAIGKAHRLYLEHPNSPPPVEQKPASSPLFPPAGHCLWGFGNPGEEPFRFCGEPASEIGSAWCPEHRKRVYARVSS